MRPSAADEAGATSEQTGRDLAAALHAGALTVPGHHLDGTDLGVELVGQGESYAAWRVRAPGHEVLFRFPRRPPREMPTTVEDEFAALQQVPEGLGSRGLAADPTTDNALGRRYLVTTFVPGRVVVGTAWTPDVLDAHTDQLARLHDAHRHEVGAPVPGARDLAAELAADVDAWAAAVPEIAEGSTALPLVAPVLEHLQRRQWAFDQGGERVLVHGDAVATNVVLDERGTPRYIDWEWAHVGDVAQDLAYIGGQVHGGPWYVPMTAQQVEAHVWRYVRARRTLPASQSEREAFDVLLARRQAWEVYERFTSSLHFERVHRTGTGTERYGPWVVTLRTTLTRLLSSGTG